MEANRLLVIDDEVEICKILSDVAESLQFDVKSIQASDQFLSVFSEFNPDLIILDLHLQKVDGIELLRLIADQHCKPEIILMSGYDEKVLNTALQLGRTHGLKMLATLHKPFQVAAIRRILEKFKSNLDVITPDKLAKAIEGHQMVLHYQPKVESMTHNIIGVEALVRWKPPATPEIFPDAFIPLAEETGLIKPLTYWVIEEAFRQIREWREENINLRVDINLSPKILVDLWLPDHIQSLINKYSIDTKWIGFEVTETAAMGQPKIVMDVLTRLRLKDCSLSIDDFGTGYSSLVELRRMPFNEIKIDKQFVINLENDKDSHVISKSIIDLAKNMGLKVVAEGVDKRESMEILQQYGCDYFQGFYISHPLEAARLKKWLLQYPDQKFIHPKKLVKGGPKEWSRN